MERRRRVRREVEFKRARQQGRCWSADVLVLCAVATGGDLTRFGFVVSKRIGGAVVRNRVKRRLRELARQALPRLAPGYDIVLITRGPIAGRASAQLAETFAGLVRRARLLRPPAPASRPASLPSEPLAAPLAAPLAPAPAGPAPIAPPLAGGAQP